MYAFVGANDFPLMEGMLKLIAQALRLISLHLLRLIDLRSV